MTVSAQPTIFQYVGNGVTTVFAYNCQVLQPSDLNVYIDGVAVLSGITKGGIGSLTGGTVTFSVAPANGAQVILEREVVLERTTDYQQNGDFLSRVVNPDFNRIWMALQQLLTGFTRALKFPKSDVSPITELPPAASRANNLLGFDASGNPVTVAPAAQSATALQTLYATSAGAGLINWVQAGVGAVMRSIMAKLRERVSVVDFGADPTGVADSLAAITAAIASFGSSPGTLYFPRGVYRITGPITIPSALSGMIVQGESPTNVYLITAGASTFDILRVEATYTTIRGLFFRPGGNQYCVRIYAAHCTLENNRALASADNVGTFSLITDVNPVGGGVVSGAYTHNIDNNVIGVAGLAFATGFDCSSTNGMQAIKFTRNQILSDKCISMPKGGGNTYAENLLQKSTAAGIGIDLGANTNGEMVYGNYIEGFLHGILIRNLSNANQVVRVEGSNHFDACTNKITTLGSINYVFENEIGVRNYNSWIEDYSSVLINRWKTPANADGFALTSAGLFLVNTTTGANHVINTTGAAQNALLLGLNGSGTNAMYFQHVTGTAANGANSGIVVKANSVTSRSINAGGTINASGADYAEYLLRSKLCGSIAKGQVIGINAGGELTDQWADAVAFGVKSTNPSLVGGDTWAAHLGERPEDPAELEAYDAAHELARARVDRIAFAGQVPVNVLGAVPGDYIVPVQDGEFIKGIAVRTPTLDQYLVAVGKVIAIEEDGRARIIVKIS